MRGDTLALAWSPWWTNRSHAGATEPILEGMAKPVHVLQRGSDVSDIVNIAVIAAVDAQERDRLVRGGSD